MSPLVSIIVPAYNAERWIEATLRSALTQTWTEIEVIVVDDGSTDGTRRIAESMQGPRLTVLSQSNGGASSARNAGLQKARGDFIQFLDADDLLAPDKIERQMERRHAPGFSGLFSGAWSRFTVDLSEARFEPYPNARDLSGVEFLQLHYEQLCMMHPAAWLASRAVLDRAGPWNESLTLNDDGEYFARVALAAGSILFCAEARSFYRSNLADSLSRRNDSRSLDSLFRSVALTTSALMQADDSPRTRAAVAYAWKWTAFELYPGRPDLSRAAEARARELGWSRRPFPASKRFQLAAPVLGWRLAKKLLLP